MNDPRVLLDLVMGVGLAAAMAALGWLLAVRVDPESPRGYAAALAFPLGAGATTLLLLILSLAGVVLNPVVVVVVIAGAMAALTAGGAVRAARSPSPASGVVALPAGGRGRAETLGLVVLGVLFAASLVVSIGRSYSTWDAAAIWGVKGYGIARAGSVLAGSEWGAYGLSYPLNLPLQIAAFAMLASDAAPVTKLIFPIYYGSLALGLLAYFRRSAGAGRAWAVVLLMAFPILFDHATQGYANLPFATYVVLGTLLAAEAAVSGRTRGAIVSGMSFALAVWTRPEGVFVVAAAYAALVVGAGAAHLGWKPGWGWVLPCLVVAGGWVVFGIAYDAGSPFADTARQAAGAITGGNANTSALYWIGRYLARDALRPSTWGVLPLVLIAGAALYWRRGRPRFGAREMMVLAAALATAAVVFAFYYLVSFSGNLEWWLDTGLSRMLLPSALLLGVWAVTPWLEPANRL